MAHLKLTARDRLYNVRLVGEVGPPVRVPFQEALRMAEEQGLDLVAITMDQEPVAKLMDYGKYRFELSKKERENKKKSVGGEIKEISISPTIGDNDLNHKIGQSIGFIKEGNKVLLRCKFKGREAAHKEVGHAKMQKVVEALADIAKVEHPLSSQGKISMITLSPLGKSAVVKKKEIEKLGE